MSISADQITIAVTVYNRRQYLKQSVGSALAQTVPVRVIVVEDCGPDLELESYVRNEFGPRVEYYRNPRRRGIFGNWNSCTALCQTPWLSILHDDDIVMPEFVASMLTLNREAGDRGLYFGQTIVVDDEEKPLPQWKTPPLPNPWLPVSIEDVLCTAPFPFPGQLFRVDYARALGGFRETSMFCGDWELWSKLIAYHGSAQTCATVGKFRYHGGLERGTSRINRSGRAYGLMNVQRKRNFALYRRLGGRARFDRDKELRRSCIPIRFLLAYAADFSPRYLAYNGGLLCRSKAPHWWYAAFQGLASIVGPRLIKYSSLVWRRIGGLSNIRWGRTPRRPAG